MVSLGIEFEELLQNIGLDYSLYSWTIPRSRHLNATVKLTGVMIAGYLSPQIIGEALAQGKNLIFTSDFQGRFRDDDILMETGEIFYKHDLFLVQWKMDWLFQSIEGQMIIAKIFEADYSQFTTTTSSNILNLSYEFSLTFSTIFQRFDQILAFSKLDVTHHERRYKRILFLTSDDTTLPPLEGDEHCLLLQFCQLSDARKYQLAMKNYDLLRIPQDLFLHEVSRELYFVLKQGTYLDISYSKNNAPKMTEIKK